MTLFDPVLGVASFSVCILGAVGVTWLSCRAELSEVPAELIRPKAPKIGKRVFLEYVPFIWSHLKFLHKVSIRNLLRYKKRFFMMVLGISGCTALLLTGFGVNDSISNLTDYQYTEVRSMIAPSPFSSRLTPETKQQFLEGMADIIDRAPCP
jgi:putative ABC transport system permease protein